MIPAAGSQLAQNRPSGTTAVSAFTATLRTEITAIWIVNTTSAAAKYSLFHDDDGSTFDQTTALAYAAVIPGNSTVMITADQLGGGISVSPDGQLGIQTDTANALTFTVYGVVEMVRRGGPL